MKSFLAHIIKETEKALQVEMTDCYGREFTTWLPKSIVKIDTTTNSDSLGSWDITYVSIPTWKVAQIEQSVNCSL